ncbi:MAG: hypothetical protein IPL38_10810 [Rhodobacter sp.]|jgi:hypothetical protein|nr:hypothetical protein [Rhodobacter sp.]MBK8439948.1 hypothetical protein [Rhodobacter sp.]
MSAVTITQMADRVSALIEERLGVRGRSLEVKVRKAGRRLPRRVREAAGNLATAGEMAKNPKLLVRIDVGAVAEAYDVCLKHLGGVNRGERRKGLVLGMAASAAFSVLAVVVLVIGFLYWRGML